MLTHLIINCFRGLNTFKTPKKGVLFFCVYTKIKTLLQYVLRIGAKHFFKTALKKYAYTNALCVRNVHNSTLGPSGRRGKGGCL